MTVWDELKIVLLDLEPQGVLTAYPDPRVDEGREPPFEIHLAPWATDAAEDLHRRFGDDVRLIVGALRYPERLRWRQHPSAPDDIPDLDPTVMIVELEAPIVVSSGRTAQGALRIHNMTTGIIVICTNGQVTAQVVDPRTRAVVGGGGGGQILPGVYFRAAPGETVVVPVLVGTASFLPELGYAVPAGEWAIRVVLELADDNGEGWHKSLAEQRRLRTPLLPISVTA
jgi:hypothetical protein